MEGRLYSGSQFTRVHAIMSRKAQYQEYEGAFHYGEEGKALGMGECTPSWGGRYNIRNGRVALHTACTLRR